ncbi:ABC transporter ATP-binding protein [bacterium]|jgi:ATP-binding cassette, subfamily B, bacterial|nr:ABC transporter ATP-binding protein [bacterium]
MSVTVENSMRKLFIYINRYKFHFWYSISSSILNKILDLMPPLLVAWVIDSVRGEPPLWMGKISFLNSSLDMAIFLSVLGFFIFGLESLFQWMYQYGFMSLAQKVQHNLRVDTYSQLQNREMAYFEDHRLGETMSVLNDDINQLENFLNHGLSDIIQLAVLFLFAGYVLAVTSWQLALVGLVPIPLIIAGSFYYQKKISPKYATIREKVGDMNSRLENNLSGILVVKSFTAENLERKRVESASDSYKEANYQAIKLNSLYVPLIRTCVAFGFSGVLLLGSYWVLTDTGVLTVGQLVLFSMLIQRVLWPLTRIGITLDDYERSKASVNRIFKMMETKSIVKDGNEILKIPKNKLMGIMAKNVSFTYSNDRPIINKLSFNILPGETVGIAGTTGSGKTTLIKLLLRFYDSTDGDISLNGQNIRSLRVKDLRENIALVSQDVYLFHGTILENIAYGMAPNTKLDDVINAAKVAELHSFVNSLSNKYETIVGERGIKLSGGQRQRLSIARAILKDAPIMIFDEATSSVDTETEREIQKNIHRITEGRTGIIIAHRLSTIRHANRIFVLKNGEMIEQGTHDELLLKNSLYADLWKIQIGEI